MKYVPLLLLAALPVTRCAQAAPACYPPNGSAEIVPTVIIQSGGACVQWHCPSTDGHQWVKNFICGTWAEATQQAIDTLKTAYTNDKATNDSLWAATFTTPVDPASTDAALIAAAAAAPYPTTIPPAGLVTIDTKVYKLSSNVNSAVFQLVGSAPLGTPCDTSQRMGTYYRIDRSKVKYPTGVLLPLTTWATCQ